MEVGPNKNSSKRTDPTSSCQVGDWWCHLCDERARCSLFKCQKCSNTFCFICIAKRDSKEKYHYASRYIRVYRYPNTSREEFVKDCPVCQNNGNCKKCFPGFSPKKSFTADELNARGTTPAAPTTTKTRKKPSFPQQTTIPRTYTTKPVFEKKEPPKAQGNTNKKRKRKIEESSESSDSSESSESEEHSESSVSSESNVSTKENINDIDIDNNDVAIPSKPSEKRVENDTFGKTEVKKVVKEDDKISQKNDQPNSQDISADNTEETETEPEVYTLPCSEFNKFDKNISEESFKVGQIWACYDSDDAMPRFYAYIKKVVTTSPGFELQIQGLKPDPVNDDEKKWVKGDLPVSCGYFKRGRPEKAENILSFSHLVVAWEEEKEGLRRINIIPRKGETWALFKNWSINWHSSDDDEERKYEYEFVEILSDYDETLGVRVLYLEKVKDFVSLFKRKKDGERAIAGSDKYRFAHIVPSYKMNGEEREGVPKGSVELDTRALPLSTFEQIGKRVIYAFDHALEDLESGFNGDLDFPKMPEVLQGDNHHEPATDQDSDETVGLWRGNSVEQAEKELLEAIENRYPKTFQKLQIRFKLILESTLKEFHGIIKRFLETSVDELTEEQLTSLREDLKEFERSGFDLSWAHKRLDMVEKLRFGNEPLRQELIALEESLEPLKKRLVERKKLFVEAQLEYDDAKDARNNKAREVSEKFGDDYDLVLKGKLGLGMLPGYY